MRLSVLIGGKAGQGINKISQIISQIMIKQGYFTFNYRDYPSIIRGGHNFNVLTISDKRIGSHESKIDFILAMDKKTVKVHKKELRKGMLLSVFFFDQAFGLTQKYIPDFEPNRRAKK